MSARPSIARTLGVLAALLAVTGVLLLLPTSAVQAGMIGTGLGPHSVAIADLNEDGYNDLISGNGTDNTIAVSLGRGNGTFDPKVQYSCDAPVSAIAVADLNKDGHLDVINVCQTINEVGMRLGAGDGTLGARMVIAVTSPTDVVIGDFDHNTWPDIAIVNGTANTLGLLRGLGGGSFGPITYFAGTGATRLAIGDVNNDTHLDVVSTRAGSSGFSLWLGSGIGGFAAPTTFTMNDIASDVMLVDLNTDGKLDVVATVPANSAVNVRLGNGDGTFGTNAAQTAEGGTAAALVSADFNGDNIPDVVVSGPNTSLVAVLIGNGNGTFQPRVEYKGGQFCDGIAVGLVDGDANLDLALAAPPQNSICTVIGNGDGTFQKPFEQVYVWVMSTGAMSDPNGWYPARTTPHPSDVLVINRGGSFGMVGVGGSVARIVISGGTTVSFSATGFGSAELAILGGAGTDLAVERSSTLQIGSFASPVILNITAGANAEINGDVMLAGAVNRLQAVSTNGIVFQSTGRAFIEDSGSPAGTITPFGTGTGASGLNSVLFHYGSQCIANYPVSVFGAAAPNAVAYFWPGSRYRQTAAFSPDVSGRTYADFEYNVPGGASAMSGSGGFQVDSLIVPAGTLTSTVTGPITIRGNIAATSGPTNLLFLPASPTTIRMAGTSRQTVRVIGTWNSAEPPLYLSPNVTLNIDNPAGVEFHIGLRTSANLSFTKGIVHAPIITFHGLYRFGVKLDSTATLTGAGPSTGWVATRLTRRVTTSGVIRMDIGDSISYQPVDLNLHGVTAPGYVEAGTGRYDVPDLGSAQLDMAHLAHRSWSLNARDNTNDPTTFLSSMDATLSFTSEDLTPGADPLQFEPRMAGLGGWSAPGYGARTATSIEVLGLSASTFNFATPFLQVGQPITPSLSVQNASESEGNGPVPGRVQPAQAQSAGSLSFRVRLSQQAIVPISVDYETVDGSATAADGDYTPTSGTLNFAAGDSALDIVVPFGVDATPEFNETFGITLSNASNATIATPTATGTILDDDDTIAPTATVLSPNGGELILQNQQVNLTWTATDNFSVTSVDLYVVRGTTAEAVAIGQPNTGSYLWTASGTASNKMKFRVVAHDVNHQTIDNSNANWELSASAIGVDDAEPLAFALPAPAPNPAPAGRNRIAFAMPHAANVKLTVHDIQGRTLAKLADGPVPAGRHERTWDATRAAAGVYFIRFEAPGFHAERRLVVIR
jgi:hypothetical protein